MHLIDIAANTAVKGLEPSSIVTIQAVVNTSAQAVTVFYILSDGTVKSRLLTEDDLQHIEIVSKERPWSFEGNAKEFKLALEAKRIELAYLFDPMMAVYSSNIEPLPHQISAVYEEMLRWTKPRRANYSRIFCVNSFLPHSTICTAVIRWRKKVAIKSGTYRQSLFSSTVFCRSCFHRTYIPCGNDNKRV